MIKKRKLIKDTLKIVKRLNIALNGDVLQKLELSLLQNSNNKEINPLSCELLASENEIHELIDSLFDAETDYAPKGLGLGSEDDERRAAEAANIANIINEWNARQ